MLRIIFNREQAVPRSQPMVLCPRLDRGKDATWPRNGRGEGPNGGHDLGLDMDVAWPRPRTGQRRDLAVAMTWQCPRSDRDCGLDLAATWPWPGNVRELTAAWPWPRISRGLACDLACPRPSCDRVLAAVSPRSRPDSKQGASRYVRI